MKPARDKAVAESQTLATERAVDYEGCHRYGKAVIERVGQL